MDLTFSWHAAMAEMPANDWQAMARPKIFPFLDWHWLHLLETSGCVGENTGWAPLHLAAYRGRRLVGAAPLYVKFHSRGEFVFDQQIAEVSQQLGMAYYPKLLGMSPFTPATGYRFLWQEDEDPIKLCSALLVEIDKLCESQQLSGCHFLRVEPVWGQMMQDLGLSPWLHHALVWENREFANFDDYLRGFRSKRRKSIRRERRKVGAQDLQIEMTAGMDAPDAWFGHMYDFYAVTCRKFFNWSRYLNRDFFKGLAGPLAKYVVFVAAFEGQCRDRPQAMSMFVRATDHLYGRYWGSVAHLDHLHFEACYYRAIEWAIAQDIPFFDAGSGNALHKRQRGFLARPVHSLHRFYEPLMAEIWHDNVASINRQEQQVIDQINEASQSA